MTEPRDPLELAHLANIVESSDDAIVSKDLNGIIRSWNRAAERMFGYSADEAIGRSVRMLIPEDLQTEEDAVLARIRDGEAIEHFETRRVHKDGHEVLISLTVSPLLDAGGRIVGASKIARDVTEARAFAGWRTSAQKRHARSVRSARRSPERSTARRWFSE